MLRPVLQSYLTTNLYACGYPLCSFLHTAAVLVPNIALKTRILEPSPSRSTMGGGVSRQSSTSLGIDPVSAAWYDWRDAINEVSPSARPAGLVLTGKQCAKSTYPYFAFFHGLVTFVTLRDRVRVRINSTYVPTRYDMCGF